MHIRIGDVAPRVQYLGDGSRTAFTYPFPVFRAEEVEVRLDGLVQPGGYAVSGAGLSEGGTVTLDVPPAPGVVVTLRRRVKLERVTDFQDNGVLRASTLNDELDRLTAALQDSRQEIEASVRQDPGEVGARLTLPFRAARANRLLGFDAAGDATVFPRDSGLLTAPFPGAVPRTVEDKLAERLSARDFGATGDGVSDDGPALQAAMNAAAAAGKHLVIGEGSFRTVQPLTLPGGAAGLTMHGLIVYAGAGGHPALTLGDGGAARNAFKLYEGLRVIRSAISDWENEADIGVLLRNLDESRVEIRQVEGFTIGIRTLGDARGFEDSVLYLGRIGNCRIGLDAHCAQPGSWNTSIRYQGGHFTVGSTVHVGKPRYGVRLSAMPDAYQAHNRHVFESPNFELRGRGEPWGGIPFLCEVASRAVIAHAMRMEGGSEFVARHTGPAQDHVYEVAWASQGYRVAVDYAPGATRAGAVVRATHMAAAHREFTRLVGEVPNLRAAAIRWNATDLGFEKLAVLSSNVSGTPAALEDFAFPALPGLALTDRGAMLTGGRAMGFVVDSRACREFALAVDADAPRLMVMCFDAAGQVMDDALGTLVLASGQTMSWNAGARWWQGGADLTDEDLLRLQAIRLHPAVATAIIGVCRIGADYEVRAMRLFCDPNFAPALLYGLPGLPHGQRELKAEAEWDPPSLAPGATATINVPVPGARPGDFCQAAWSASTTLPLLAGIGAGDTVTVRLWNATTQTVDMAPGTVRVRVVKS